MAIISFQGVSKRYYRDFWRRRPVGALDNFTMEVERGSCFAFLGLNGAGKSTAIRVLLGFSRPDAGAAVIHRPAAQAHPFSGVGFLAEAAGLPDHLSPLAILETAARLHGLPPPRAAERAREVLEFVGLAGIRGRCRELSRGMRQRLGLAQALVNDPDLLVLDEPFTGLDIAGRREIIARLRLLHRQGKTIFFSSHILGDVARLASHVGIIHQGRCLGTMPVGGLDEEALEELFLARLASAAGSGGEVANG
ncbi:MAG: ABC transporter ATP-binding protein [Deltaproteobacteria bacterium]|nr:ABC transporter ATP-binding protein [Deltaproteobacteria bacterium]